jgi:hypothetical protein
MISQTKSTGKCSIIIPATAHINVFELALKTLVLTKITFLDLFQLYQTLHKFIFVETKQYFCKKLH